MLAILIFLNAHNLPIFSSDFDNTCFKIHGHRDFSDKTYLSLGLLSP